MSIIEKEVGETIDGKKQGKWISYYKGGEIASEVLFEEGIEQGKYFLYYRDGKLLTEGNYKDIYRKVTPSYSI